MERVIIALMKKIIWIAVIIGVIAVVVLAVKNNPDIGSTLGGGGQVTSADEPIHIALDFYSLWLDEAKASDSDPYTAGLQQTPILSPALRDKIAAAQSEELDPVLCQKILPEKVSGRVISTSDTEAQILVLSREPKLSGQAKIIVRGGAEKWYIDDIVCADGESAPEQEFSFEHRGQIVKDVPAPLDATFWHIVYAQDGGENAAAPLLFDAESVCVATDGAENACTPDSFTPAAAVSVQGNMTESGVNVVRMRML